MPTEETEKTKCNRIPEENTAETTEDKNSLVADFLELQVDKIVDVDFFDNDNDTSTADVIGNTNLNFLYDVLSPEITNNETKKRDHKDRLMKWVKNFLLAQFIIVAGTMLLVLVSIFVSHWIKNPLGSEIIQLLFAFIGTYITSVVVELIFILKYIVTSVFDSSIKDLASLFLTTNSEEKEKKGLRKK